MAVSDPSHAPLAALRIGEHHVGAGFPCFIVAEVAQAHDGSLGTAHAYIDAVAKCGVQAVKFQTHIADAESTPGEPFRVNAFPQDASRYDYWKRMEFSHAAWRALADHARDVGLVFLSSAFSFEAVELLQGLDMQAYKVGSGELTNLPLIERMADTGKPLLLSSGMATLEELDRAVAIAKARTGCAVFQCTTSYPCPPERAGLNVLAELRSRYACPVGFSDHSGNVAAGLAAVTLGANLLEVHIVFSRECFGPDVSSSLTLEDLRRLSDGARFIETALCNPIDKDAAAAALSELKTIFGKSVVLDAALPAGHVLRREDLALKKPATGIPAARLKEVVGRRTRRALPRSHVLMDSDLD
jgi:N-acetylneuraminate synthase